MHVSRLPVYLAFVAASVASAQAKTPGIEIGVRSGWTHTRVNSGGVTEKLNTVAVPAGLFGAVSGVHVTVFPWPRLALEPQLGVVRVTRDGDTFSVAMFAGQGMVFLRPDAEHAPYLFGQALWVQTDNTGGNSQGQYGFGGGIGLRQVVRKSLGLRYELRLQGRWGSNEDATEVALLFGMGTVLGH